LEHELFFDGNLKEYSWSIKTGEEVVNQIREHPPAYLSGGKLEIENNEESRFVHFMWEFIGVLVFSS